MIEVTPDPATHPILKDGKYILEHYNAVINVADTQCLTFKFAEMGIPSFWIPIDELDYWNYSPFYAAAKIFDKYKGDKPVLIHCHAGANRSPTIAYAILKSEGLYIADIKKIIGFDHSSYFDKNIKKGYIPGDIIDFLKNRKKFPEASLMELRRKTNASYPRIKAEPLTAEYLLSRGECCELDCVNCPYRGKNKLTSF